MKIINIYKKNPIHFCLWIILIISLVLIVGLIFLPSIFYDQWIWKYYWGPVIADASGVSVSYNGIIAQEGYTIVSEFTYGIILIFSIYCIYKLLKKLKIIVDWKFALALMPYILYGSISRVLEDTGFFIKPISYWFISPLIYLQIAFFAICFLLLGYYLEKKLNILKIKLNTVLFLGGLIFLIPTFYLIGMWISGRRWGPTTGIRFDVFLIIFSIVFIITMVVYLISYIFRKNEKISVYKNPLNLSMLIGHIIDGFTSYISIKDPLSMGLFYSEKHPASNTLLEIWGPLFPIVKFILIIIIIYIFDIYFKNELKDHLTLVNILKLCILILGFSPGVRDLLRVTMGV